MRTLLMNLPSPAPFNRLGVGVGVPLLAAESRPAFGFRTERALSPASGLDGMLLRRVSPLGGFGKELMLTVFRMVLVAAAAAGPAFGKGGMLLLLEGAEDAEEGGRRPLRGALGDFAGLGMAAMLFRLLGTESVGREVSGGPIEGRGRGRAVAILSGGAVQYVYCIRSW